MLIWWQLELERRFGTGRYSVGVQVLGEALMVGILRTKLIFCVLPVATARAAATAGYLLLVGGAAHGCQ